MGIYVLERMDAVMERAGTTDPIEIADFLGVVITHLTGALIGYVRKCKQDVFIGLHVCLGPRKRAFTLLHELAHLLCHMDAPGFCSGHGDGALFSPAHSVFDRRISIQEREANLASAEYSIPTDDVLEMVGYNNGDMRELRRKQKEFGRLKNEYEGYLSCFGTGTYSRTVREHIAEYREQLREMSEELEDIRGYIDSDCTMTIEQMARALRCNTVMVEYKLAALRLRGYDFDDIELAGYDRVFRERL